MTPKMSRLGLTLMFALALPVIAQTGPAQPKSVRPSEPVALGTEYMTWSTGVSYAYDGAGNIRSIGSDSYVYDAAGRLVQSDLTGTRSNFGYDAFGNRIYCTQGAGNCQYSAIDAPTNRLSSATYETGGSGNVADFGGHTYAYDAVNMATRDLTVSSTREFVYTADDERLAVYTVGGGAWNWTVRDVSGKVLREFTSQNPASGPMGSDSWAWSKDYVWREGILLASRQMDPFSGSLSTDHYHLDYLGTPRRITDDHNRIVGIHDYYAFGAEDPHGTNESPITRMRFTAHERDGAGASAGPGMLDYMHARYYDPVMGRFLSVDPTLDVTRAIHQPQMWNRYSYVINNPIRNMDPDGREHVLEPGFTKSYSEWHDALQFDENTPAVIKGSFYAEGFLLTLAADEFVIGPAVGSAISWAANTVRVRMALNSASAAIRLEGQMGRALGSALTQFKKAFSLAGEVGEIDAATSKAVIEVTLGKGKGKLAQLNKLKEAVAGGREVILVGKNIGKHAAAAIRAAGYKIFETVEEAAAYAKTLR